MLFPVYKMIQAKPITLTDLLSGEQTISGLTDKLFGKPFLFEKEDIPALKKLTERYLLVISNNGYDYSIASLVFMSYAYHELMQVELSKEAQAFRESATHYLAFMRNHQKDLVKGEQAKREFHKALNPISESDNRLEFDDILARAAGYFREVLPHDDIMDTRGYTGIKRDIREAVKIFADMYGSIQLKNAANDLIMLNSQTPNQMDYR